MIESYIYLLRNTRKHKKKTVFSVFQPQRDFGKKWKDPKNKKAQHLYSAVKP